MTTKKRDEVHQRFHDARGRLSAIITSVELMRMDAHGVSPDQESHLERIDATANDLVKLLLELEAIVHPGEQQVAEPALGSPWIIPCLDGSKLRPSVIKHQLTQLRQRTPALVVGNAIIVSTRVHLAAIRAFFNNAGWRTRPVTHPTDIAFLLDVEQPTLLVMAPPPDEAEAWWHEAQQSLSRLSELPILLHLTPIGGALSSPDV